MAAAARAMVNNSAPQRELFLQASYGGGVPVSTTVEDHQLAHLWMPDLDAHYWATRRFRFEHCPSCRAFKTSTGRCEAETFGSPLAVAAMSDRCTGSDWLCSEATSLGAAVARVPPCVSSCSEAELEAMASTARVAVFTQVHNESSRQLAAWLSHAVTAVRVPAHDVYVVQVDTSTETLTQYDPLYAQYGIPAVNTFEATSCVVNNSTSSPATSRGGNTHSAGLSAFYVENAAWFQGRLRSAGYSHVLYTDVDEFVLPHLTKYPNGVAEYVRKNLGRVVVATNGHEVVDRESACRLRENGDGSDGGGDAARRLRLQTNLDVSDSGSRPVTSESTE